MLSIFSERGQELQSYLLEPLALPVIFDTNGIARLTNWFYREQSGAPRFLRQTNGQSCLLAIQAHQPSAGGWCSRVIVPEGTYQFHCRAKSEPLSASSNRAKPAVRVGLAGDMAGRALLSSGEWEELSFPFVAPRGGRKIEFICKLQIGTGTILFDADSLRVVREIQIK